MSNERKVKCPAGNSQDIKRERESERERSIPSFIDLGSLPHGGGWRKFLKALVNENMTETMQPTYMLIFYFAVAL